MDILDFKQFIENIAGGSMVPTGYSNSDSDQSNFVGRTQLMPGTDFVMGSNGIDLPTVVYEGPVVEFLDKITPMQIIIMDKNEGRKTLIATMDQMKKFQGELPIVKNHSYIKAKLLRNPNDKTLNPSSILQCMVKFNGNSGLRNQYNISINSNSFMYTPL